MVIFNSYVKLPEGNSGSLHRAAISGHIHQRAEVRGLHGQTAECDQRDT
jgi:hypothetical protein